MGKSERRAVRSYLLRLLEHLLQRNYVPMSDCYRGWEIEIKNFQQQLQFELEDSPSLKNFMADILEKNYQMTLQNVKDVYPNVAFPKFYPFSENIDDLITKRNWA